MRVFEARAIATEWVLCMASEWPGLVGAHLVGGITEMPDDAPFPASKDLDLHLIFRHGSAQPPSASPKMPIIESAVRGISIEAGMRTVDEYRSPEAVLGNPEIAHHLLTTNGILFDPSGWLRDLRENAASDYRHPRWVAARLAHERNGYAGALANRALAIDWFGGSGELNIMGYLTTFPAAALDVAALRAPRIGGRVFQRLRTSLEPLGRIDLFEEALTVLGVADAAPAFAHDALVEAAAAFDAALAVQRTPHFFQHKLQPHLRAYFVDACAEMIAEGAHREALCWIAAYHCSCHDVLIADGDAEMRQHAATRQQAFLGALGFADAAGREVRLARATRLHDAIFALAEAHVALAAVGD